MKIKPFRLSVLILCASIIWCPLTLGAIKQNTVENYLSAAKKAGLTPNKLINQSSPYLLQHAYNPVHWYAWGEEAFAKARKENKAIFLSIGYSTCHWCHVMAHESFENEQVAALLNKHFISIKVDREERPDVDKVYMAATQLINGHGGWPMTVFLNNKLEPFHAGTYYPRESSNGYRGLIDLLKTINTLWLEERQRIDLVAKSITKSIAAEENVSPAGTQYNVSIHKEMYQQITASFDTEYGGFGSAPKFPRMGIFSYLMSIVKQDSEGDFGEKGEAQLILKKTLSEMAYGGIYDQMGGGFHRYSVDEQWQVPHFEKMLYSQALMTLAYVDLYEHDRNPLYASVIENTLAFVAHEMTHPQGGFYSALDADSAIPETPDKKAEGAYYLWSESDLKRILNAQEWKLFKPYFNIEKDGNIDSDPQDEFGDKNILYVSDDYKNVTLKKKQKELLSTAFMKLNQVRLKRPRPHLDDKIITAWNGMMISALSNASQLMNKKQYISAASKAAEFLEKNLLNKKTATLKRSMRANKVSVDSGLSDYVWYIRGLIDLYVATENKHWLSLAIVLQKKQDELFYDKSSAAYFDFGTSDSSLLFRSKSVYDGALPAVNAIAIQNLFELSTLTKNTGWKLKAEQSLKYFSSAVNQNPLACASLLAVRNLSLLP